MRYLYLALVIFITGCTTMPQQGFDSDSAHSVDAWEIKGRLAAKIDRDGGSASFIWQRQGDEHSIELYGPLGSGRIFLKQSQGKASLIDNSTEFFGKNLEDVLFQRVGWLIPFDYLQLWLIGRPQLDAISDQHYEQDRLVKFSQAGWQVSYNKFETFSGIDSPTKITLNAADTYLDELSSNAGREIENARVKIVIKQFIRG